MRLLIALITMLSLAFAAPIPKAVLEAQSSIVQIWTLAPTEGGKKVRIICTGAVVRLGGGESHPQRRALRTSKP
ncbi:hypothetical protein OFP00_36780, partial [Escherichia coli]|nr:hypothetical protein [Escherichia coli]